MDLESLKLADLARVARVFEHRGFTAAGRSLGESTKQVSRGVARVEEALGLRLFHRSTRSVLPTDEGEVLYSRIRRVLDVMEGVEQDLSSTGRIAGRLRVQVMTLFADDFIRWLAEALPQHPELEVDVVVRDHVDDVIGEGLDLALMAGRPADPALVVRRLGLGQAPMGAHVDYLARRGVPQSPADLAAHECLRFGDRDRQPTWSVLDPSGQVHQVAVGGQLVSNDSRMLQQALQLGLGIGPVLDVRAQRIQPVLPGWRFGPIPMFLALAPGRRHLARVRLVLDGLVEVVTPWLAP